MGLVGRQLGALSGAAGAARAQPAAAAKHSLRASLRPARILLHSGRRVRTVPILAPLVHVAVHVEQAERVAFVAADLAGVALIQPAAAGDRIRRQTAEV